MRQTRWLTAWLLGLGLVTQVFAAQFTVEDIRVEGLRRISPGTIFTYLPVKVGDRFDEANAGDAIRALFKTGFFKDVQVEREGSTLVVIVDERPSIASVSFNGNENLKRIRSRILSKRLVLAKAKFLTGLSLTEWSKNFVVLTSRKANTLFRSRVPSRRSSEIVSAWTFKSLRVVRQLSRRSISSVTTFLTTKNWLSFSS